MRCFSWWRGMRVVWVLTLALVGALSVGVYDVAADPAYPPTAPNPCSSYRTTCGNFCLYAYCLECTILCDENGCREVDPCLRFDWRLNGPGNTLLETYASPNVDQAVDLAVTWVPADTTCSRGGGDLGFGSIAAHSPGSGGSSGYSGVLDSAPLEIADLPGLVVIAGQPGGADLAPIDVIVDDASASTVRLTVTGGGGGSLEYRYWLYNGQEPGDVEVPFVSLSGDVTIATEIYGIVSFQVRRVSGGVIKPRSNVENVFLGALKAKMLPPAADPADLTGVPFVHYSLETPTPIPVEVPVREVGVVRLGPAAPEISSVAPVPGVVGRVRVVLSTSYSGRLQYRAWQHGGNYPGIDSPWLVVPGSVSYFFIDGICGEIHLDGDVLQGWVEREVIVNGVPTVVRVWSLVGGGEARALPIVYDFEVRVLGPGDVVGPSSTIRSLVVWGEVGCVSAAWLPQ